MPHSKSKKPPRPGSIGEFVQKGGKLPGEKGVDQASLRNEIKFKKQETQKTQQEKIQRANATTRGKEAIAGFEQSVAETPQPKGLSFTEEQVALIKTGDSIVDKNTREAVLAGNFNLVTDIQETSQVQKTGLTGLGFNPIKVGSKITAGLVKNKNLGKLVNDLFKESVTQKGKTTARINSVTLKHMNNIIKKQAKPRSLVAIGGTIAAAASSTFLGLWGQAEAGEPLSIVMRDVLREAQQTGDYSLYNEAKEARDDIINLPLWQRLSLFTPFSPFIGIPNKLRGVIKAAKVQDQLAKDLQVKTESGQTDNEFWEEVRNKETEEKKIQVNYYNQQSVLYGRHARDAEKVGRDEDAKFWLDNKRKILELEEAQRNEDAAFWLEYRKQAEQIKADDRSPVFQKSDIPSKLNFGLI